MRWYGACFRGCLRRRSSSCSRFVVPEFVCGLSLTLPAIPTHLLGTVALPVLLTMVLAQPSTRVRAGGVSARRYRGNLRDGVRSTAAQLARTGSRTVRLDSATAAFCPSDRARKDIRNCATRWSACLPPRCYFLSQR